MSSVLSLLPKSWLFACGGILLLALVAVGGFCAWQGYGAGFERAEALGQASLAAEKQDRAEENVARALAVAKAEREARQKYEEQVARNAALDSQLAEAKSVLVAERKRFNQRIADAAIAAANTCAGLPAEWVRLYNEAYGAGGVDGIEGGVPGGASQTSGASSGSGSRLSQPEPLTSPADILSHARDMGQEYQELKAQLNTLIDAVDGGKRE